MYLHKISVVLVRTLFIFDSTHMNPNTGQPIQDPKLINPSAQDPATALTSEQKAIQAEQELQQ